MNPGCLIINVKNDKLYLWKKKYNFLFYSKIFNNNYYWPQRSVSLLFDCRIFFCWNFAVFILLIWKSLIFMYSSNINFINKYLWLTSGSHSITWLFMFSKISPWNNISLKQFEIMRWCAFGFVISLMSFKQNMKFSAILQIFTMSFFGLIRSPFKNSFRSIKVQFSWAALLFKHAMHSLHFNRFKILFSTYPHIYNNVGYYRTWISCCVVLEYNIG